MSSNNQVVIIKEKHRRFPKKEVFLIYENPCVDNPFKPDDAWFIGRGNTLEEAIQKANNYMQKNIVEYGLDVRI